MFLRLILWSDSLYSLVGESSDFNSFYVGISRRCRRRVSSFNQLAKVSQLLASLANFTSVGKSVGRSVGSLVNLNLRRPKDLLTRQFVGQRSLSSVMSVNVMSIMAFVGWSSLSAVEVNCLKLAASSYGSR